MRRPPRPRHRRSCVWPEAPTHPGPSHVPGPDYPCPDPSAHRPIAPGRRRRVAPGFCQPAPTRAAAGAKVDRPAPQLRGGATLLPGTLSLHPPAARHACATLASHAPSPRSESCSFVDGLAHPPRSRTCARTIPDLRLSPGLPDPPGWTILPAGPHHPAGTSRWLRRQPCPGPIRAGPLAGRHPLPALARDRDILNLCLHPPPPLLLALGHTS
jgi:hypothetical protein